MTQRIAWLTVLLGSALIAAPFARASATTHTSGDTTTHAAHASATHRAASGNATSVSSGNRSTSDDNTDGKHTGGNNAACVDNSSTTIVPQATCSHNGDGDNDNDSGSAGGSGLSWQSLLPGSIQ